MFDLSERSILVMGAIGAIWGILGILGLLCGALLRLVPHAAEAFMSPLRWYHWLASVACIIFMAHAEGYRGFQGHFSPRVVARAAYLQKHPRILHVILAPLFCMGFIHATRRRKIVALSLTLGIIVMVLAVRWLPQPWRGILDGGVGIGLAWGLTSILWFAAKAWVQRKCEFPTDVPS